MTVNLADARHTAEAAHRPERLAFKTGVVTDGGLVALDDAEGIVTAIVSVTGTEDEVADIIVPGAYRETLTKRRPKVCWAHSWERPIGRVLHIEELLPGDDRLPPTTKDGKPWPMEAGALVATMQFNMKSDAGREAFEAARFYSESGEAEWSIGYQVPAGKSTRDKAGVRHIKALELYELSLVLFGAHTLTGTLSIKDAARLAREGKHIGTAVENYDPDVDYGALGAEAKVLPETPDDSPGDFSDGVMVAVYPDPEAATALANAVAGPDRTLDREEFHVTLAYLGKTTDLGNAAVTDDDIVKRVTDAVEAFPSVSGEIGGIGMFPESEDAESDGAPTWVPVDVPGLSLLREQVADALGDLVSTDHGFTPHITLGYGIGLLDPIPPIPVKFSEVRVVWGTSDRRIPLGPEQQPEIKSQETPVDDDADLTALLDGYSDDDWTALIESDAPAEDAEIKATTPGGRQGDDSPVGTPGGQENWVDQTGGLPRYIRMIAHALIRKGMAKGRAIATAVNTVKRWAAGGGDVSPKVQAAAAKAVAEWEANKVEAHADDAKAAVGSYDPAYEAKSPDVSDSKGYPRFPGTYEARMDAVRCAVTEALRGEPDEENRYEWDYVDIDATWDDRLIATRVRWEPNLRETFEIGYTYSDGMVDLTEPEPVELQIVTVYPDGIAPEETETDEGPTLADALPLAESVWTVASAFQAAKVQTKAGRVLSGANERRLRQAVETLLTVLAAAGVEIDPSGEGSRDDGTTPQSDPRREVDPRVDLESTAPAAQAKSLTGGEILTITPEQIQADLARLSEGLDLDL